MTDPQKWTAVHWWPQIYICSLRLFWTRFIYRIDCLSCHLDRTSSHLNGTSNFLPHSLFYSSSPSQNTIYHPLTEARIPMTILESSFSTMFSSTSSSNILIQNIFHLHSLVCLHLHIYHLVQITTTFYLIYHNSF